MAILTELGCLVRIVDGGEVSAHVTKAVGAEVGLWPRGSIAAALRSAGQDATEGLVEDGAEKGRSCNEKDDASLGEGPGDDSWDAEGEVGKVVLRRKRRRMMEKTTVLEAMNM